IICNGAILLVRERSDGRWTLPGGWADPGESPSECVVREIREESGFETRAVKLLAVFDRSRHSHESPMLFSVYKMFFRCEVIGGAACAGAETTEVRFFDEHELPELSSARVTSGQIERMFLHERRSDLPTDFD